MRNRGKGFLNRIARAWVKNVVRHNESIGSCAHSPVYAHIAVVVVVAVAAVGLDGCRFVGLLRWNCYCFYTLFGVSVSIQAVYYRCGDVKLVGIAH